MAVVGIVVFELHIPGARSLKSKRREIKSLIDRLHARYRVSVAETDLHDLHQRSEICLALVGSREQDIEQKLERLRDLIESEPAVMLSSWSPELLESSASPY